MQARKDQLVQGAGSAKKCEQSTRMMKHNCVQKLHTNVTSNKRLAAKVMLTFSAPSPDKVLGVPSQYDRAQVLGVPQTEWTKSSSRNSGS
jgi:hypothetical protein